MSVNKVILLGRLGKDPELKHTPSGASVCNFSIATSEYWQDKNGQKQERTEWHNIVVWGKQADHCAQYLAKGRQAYVEGRLQTRSWDAQDGTKRYMTEVVATGVQFIGGQAQQGQGSYNQNQGQKPQAAQQQQQEPIMNDSGPVQSGPSYFDDDGGIPF